MVFGNPPERNIAELSEKIEELKNQRKLVELDLEKRILVLEGAANSLQKLFGDLKDFEAAKDALSRLDSVQNKLREIEDVGLISRLETVQEGDRIALLEETAGELKEKMKLLSDAIDLLGEAKAGPHGANAADTKELATLRAELNSVREALTKLAAGTIPSKSFSELGSGVEKAEERIQQMDKAFGELAETVRQRLELMDRKVSRRDVREVPERLLRDVSGMQKEIGQLKNIQEQIVRQIEIDSKKIQQMKSLEDERKDYLSLKKNLDATEKSVLLLKKEMALDRTMYPETIMRLEKEIAAIKGIKNAAAKDPAIPKMHEIMNSLADELKKIKEKLPKYEESIESVGRNNDLLKEGMSEAITAVKARLAETSELRNEMALLRKQVSDIQQAEKIYAVPKYAEATKAKTKPFKKEMQPAEDIKGSASELASVRQRISSLEQELRDFRQLADSLARENQEFAAGLGEACAEIAKMREKQPLIID